MSTVIAPAGLVPLNAPLPAPRQFDLLAAATLVDPASQRWLAGGWTGGDAPGPAYTHDPCSSGTDRVKMGAGIIGRQMNGRFSVYLPGFCTAQSIGPNPTYWTDRLNLVFQVYEGAAVERVLVSGDGHATLGPYLGDTNMEILGSGAQTALRAFELLESEIALNGSGIIHAAPATAAAWDAAGVTENVRGIKRSKTSGNPVAVGAGYIAAVPDGQGAPASDQEWAFASGPIEVFRGEIETVPANYAQALDRAMNDVLFLAERPYLLNWIARQDAADDNHIQAGVLIDLVP